MRNRTHFPEKSAPFLPSMGTRSFPPDGIERFERLRSGRESSLSPVLIRVRSGEIYESVEGAGSEFVSSPELHHPCRTSSRQKKTPEVDLFRPRNCISCIGELHAKGLRQEIEENQLEDLAHPTGPNQTQRSVVNCRLCLDKNPSTIRIPEEDRGKENFTMTAWVTLERSSSISRHIASLCAEASDSTYARDVDLRAWAELPGSVVNSIYPFGRVEDG
uniref:Out at first protein BRICHOS-like domain-containing protein n=1 Tax=Lutzomyia longipalpis TaxID=7200 RepID=A0A1B0CT74_LUTLO